MKTVLNKDKLNNLTNEIWKSAERLRGKFKAYEYQSVILPVIVIRRLECVLISWRKKQASEILKKRPNIKKGALATLVKKLELNPQKSPFSNKTNWTLAAICKEDPTLMEKNFRDYINGFSDNIQDIIDHFDYRAVVGRMVKNARLAPILRQYANERLGPDHLSNLEMGYIYEELLRRFSEQSGEEAGEHFTPREVIRLMVELLDIPMPKKHLSIYDPACGTGGMLSIAKEHLLDKAATDKEKKSVERFVTVHGHELQPGNYAICQSDMLIKDDKQAEICYGNSLIPHSKQSREPGDQLAGAQHKFDFMLSNPPFGVTWGGKDGYEKEAKKYKSSRYQAGMPRTNDGALLFLQTMLAKMKPVSQGGSRIAIIFNGSPLSNGDCGSGESEIRRWILENDWLDAIVMLPDQMFYNTGIYTYIWLLTNNKPVSRKQRVRIIDARKQFDKEPKSFGNKRNRILDRHRQWIIERYRSNGTDDQQNDHVKIFRNKDFAYHKVNVVFWQTDENDQAAYLTEPYSKAFTPANIKKEQQFYESDLDFRIHLKLNTVDREISFTLGPEESFVKIFEKEVKDAFAEEISYLTENLVTATEKNKAIKAFIKGLEVAAEFTHRHYVSDNEYIQYGEDIEEFLKREIAKPIIRWQDSPQLGYEILPNKYFYKYQPPKHADELLKEFWALEKDAEKMLAGLGVDK
ncbi:MAG: type I restriction-modification system subunit M [Deltaproteobacteria bacterium]|jgi:type I restriction enzyme M protein|nr:type I restriction-modification system subunit M [Deltaproteobacteria bacterium]